MFRLELYSDGKAWDEISPRSMKCYHKIVRASCGIYHDRHDRHKVLNGYLAEDVLNVSCNIAATLNIANY